MNVLLLNLPHPTRLMRRYVASYNAVNFLMPPLELLGLAGILKEWKGRRAQLLDAVAEGLDEEQTLKEVEQLRPDLVVSLIGFRAFKNDVEFLGRIKKELPGTKVVCFGYLAGMFAGEILERCALDAVIAEEPELAFSDLYDRYAAGDSPEGIEGVTWRENGTIHQNVPAQRIRDLDVLPFPDHSLPKLDLYNESFLGRPIATTVSARGCPFQCTYCVRMYGKEIVYRSAENVVAEIEAIQNEHSILNLRFMDDTFTLNRRRTLDICRGIQQRKLNTRWTCLTRIDSLDEEMLTEMSKAGCLRLYMGLESGSQRVLDAMKKGLTVETIREKMKIVRASGIEASAFFIAGFPGETEEDHQESVALAKEVGLDYIIVTKAQYWPGTELFAKSGRPAFDPWNPRSEGDPQSDSAGFVREQDLYRKFYFRPNYILKQAGKAIKSPKDVAQGLKQLIQYSTKPRGGDNDFI